MTRRPPAGRSTAGGARTPRTSSRAARKGAPASKPAASKGDPFAPLVCIDRLEVGPIRVEPARVIATYRVFRGSESTALDLVYRYEEDVFDPDDPADRNLAATIASQVALNYGLFCREIVFHGELDDADRRFLTQAAVNTAREIYVLKFLKENPFLVGEAASLPAVRRESYLRAKLRFRGDTRRVKPAPWTTDPARHVVLSSGGKDSLLTFGILRELGHEVHPVFVNESGRHWYTALNAYRHLSGEHATTARVWTNSDRLFSWMLRHLPFIRPGFARIRADEYPIRLWTVAVFLFGALPLLRKRGAGRLLIGDEFDTTVRARHRGISHYAGLYDQSRYFDNALTRYFQRKGWGVSQFSILRPLSELLIQKTLTERYPDLRKHQVSCHAAHGEGGRIRPCGRCEKCRRIVGMLKAIDADPTDCGYREEQVAACLTALAERGVHQESPGAAHLGHLLEGKGLLSPNRAVLPGARPHPEVMSLRFDHERSPVESVPNDLRPGILRIMLEHAEGALTRSGRRWLPVDPLSAEMLARPYPFERKGRPAGAPVPGAGSSPSYLLAELTWPEARARFAETDIALLPVGAIEQHGPHLPLDTDAFDADYLARRVAAACSEPRPLVLPLIPYGVSYHHEDFVGTLSVMPHTLASMVREVGLCAARYGTTKLLIVNGHGGNAPALHYAAQMINREAHIFTCVDTGETSDADVAELTRTHNDVHAGEIETSTTLAVRPELVRLDRARADIPRFSSEFLDFTTKRSVGWYAHTQKISATGVMGDPTVASREKGERIWAIMTRRLVELVEELKRMSLDEIHQKRY